MASLATFQGYISNGTSGVAGTQLNVTTMTTGTIQLGMAITGGATAANTHIVAFITGTGTTGLYEVSRSQTIGQSGNPASFSGTTAGVITAADYNYVQTKVAAVMGTPSTINSTPYGYNQTLVSSPLSAGTTSITAAQWNNLRTDLVNAYTHQGSPGGLTLPPIQAKLAANAGGSITSADFQKYLALGNTIYTTPLAIAASGQSSFVTVNSGVRTTGWNSTVTHQVILTWPSANAAKGFFNAGGYFTFSASLTGYSVSDPGYAKDVDWNTLLTDLKTVTFTYNSTSCNGSYTTITTNTGFYGLSTSSTNIINKTTSSTSYAPNQYDIYATLDSTGAILTFSIQFKDLATVSGHSPLYGIDENVTGTLTSTVKAFYASGSAVQSAYPTVTPSGP